MGGKQHRERLRANARKLESSFAQMARECPNCKEALNGGGHFVPPSTGERGFYICKPAPNPQEVQP